MRKKSIILLFLFLFCCNKTWAQYKVSGKVIDENNVAVRDAVVIFQRVSDEVLIANSLTNEKGEFSTELIEGEYILNIKSFGFYDYLNTIFIDRNTSVSSIVLIASDEINLEGIITTARKRKPIVSMVNNKIQVNVAESYLVDLGSAVEVLRSSPGISIDRKGNLSLLSVGGVAVYVNDKKLMLQGEELTSYLRSISSSKIEKIEISSNPNAKYGADGSGGIINIVLRKELTEGYYLTTSHSLSYWENLKESSDVSMAYNKGKWQMEINYNHTLGNYAYKYGTDRVQNENRNLSKTEDIDKRNSYAGGFNFSWLPNNKHYLNFNSSVSLLNGPGKTITETKIFNGINELVKILEAENDYTKQKDLRYGGDLKYLFKPTNKQSFSLSFDWMKLDGESKNNQPNNYFSPSGVVLNKNFYQSQSEKDIEIYATMLDYTFAPDDKKEFSAGVKASQVESDNAFKFSSISNRSDSNHFKYNEQNLETYLNYTTQWNPWSFTAGVRLEYMKTKSELISYEAENDKEDEVEQLEYFPNLSLSYAMNDKTRLSFNYSRRQDKPKYEDLNPFEYLLDELTYWKGNPFLKPQFNNKFSIRYTKLNLGVTLTYENMINYFSSFTDEYKEGTTIMTTKNIGNQQQWALNVIYSKRLRPWWDINVNSSLFYLQRNLDYEAYQEEYKRPSFSLSIANDVALPQSINLELSARFNSKRLGGGYEILKPSGSVDVSLNKKIFNNKFTCSLLMTDIFHTERWDSYGTKKSLSLNSWGYGESRRIIAKIQYSLGQQKTNKTNKTIEEIERL